MNTAPPICARKSLSRIEDLSDALKGAGLEAMQMARTPLTGSLVFLNEAGATITSGWLGTRVALSGPLSETLLAIGIGLRIAPGSYHWKTQEVHSGSIGVFRPPDTHEALYQAGSIYATMTLEPDRLEEVAAGMGMVLDQRTLRDTGFDQRKLPPAQVSELLHLFQAIHKGRAVAPSYLRTVHRTFASVVVNHLGRRPRPVFGIAPARGHARAISLAREYIDANLDRILTVEDVADAAMTSRRTLYRAFDEILGLSPNVYIRTLRLNRMRQSLSGENGELMSVTRAASTWGLDHFGRASGWYRDLFGELPSQTLARTEGRSGA